MIGDYSSTQSIFTILTWLIFAHICNKENRPFIFHILKYIDGICSLHTTRQVSHLWIAQLALIVWASQYLGHILWSKASSWEVLGSLQYSLQTVKWLLLLGRLPGVLKTRVELGFKRGPAIVQGNQFVWESQMIK